MKQIAKNFNIARMNLSNIKMLEREDVENILVASGFPKGNAMVAECVRFGIVVKHGNNKYTLPNDPVYYQKIGNAIDAYHRKKNVTAALYRARIARDIEYSKNFLEKHDYKVIGVK